MLVAGAITPADKFELLTATAFSFPVTCHWSNSASVYINGRRTRMLHFAPDADNASAYLNLRKRTAIRMSMNWNDNASLYINLRTRIAEEIQAFWFNQNVMTVNLRMRVTKPISLNLTDNASMRFQARRTRLLSIDWEQANSVVMRCRRLNEFDVVHNRTMQN